MVDERQLPAPTCRRRASGMAPGLALFLSACSGDSNPQATQSEAQQMTNPSTPQQPGEGNADQNPEQGRRPDGACGDQPEGEVAQLGGMPILRGAKTAPMPVLPGKQTAPMPNATQQATE